jgi:L-ascorbate metabolism protein UlaG (beta-lactamase superfamily)
MRITKFGHACVKLEKDGASLVIDPGAFTEPEALAGANAVLITHEHFDHIEPERLRAALAADPGLGVWTNASVAGQLGGPGGQVHVVAHGDDFTAAGFSVAVHGSEHAVVHQDIPIVANTGFLVDGEVFHPGDALTVPEDPVGTLLIPVSAPWLKLSEVIDYGRHVAPRRAYAIHDALLSDIGLTLVGNWLPMAAGDGGGVFAQLARGESADL